MTTHGTFLEHIDFPFPREILRVGQLRVENRCCKYWVTGGMEERWYCDSRVRGNMWLRSLFVVVHSSRMSSLSENGTAHCFQRFQREQPRIDESDKRTQAVHSKRLEKWICVMRAERCERPGVILSSIASIASSRKASRGVARGKIVMRWAGDLGSSAHKHGLLWIRMAMLVPVQE